jgi:glycosyltransferase involved in cell wall biosynthesis
MSAPELSIVVPFLNEEQVLPLLRERLEKIRNRPAAWELLFISDGSTDGSTRFIETWARIDPSVKLVVLTRNFGHQSAISAGLSLASGKCVGIMDADLQDEPEVAVFGSCAAGPRLRKISYVSGLPMSLFAIACFAASTDSATRPAPSSSPCR